MNSEAHREALQKVLEQAYVEHDVTVDQFDHIVVNITSCNNMIFCDDELPEEGRNHNLALHISMNCKEDALSNVLVDTGSSLNMFPNSTPARLSYQGAPMRYSGVIVKAFDGSRKTVIGEVYLPIKIVSSDFQITFQNGKLVIVGGEKALLVGHLSSFSYVDVEEEVGTTFQALSITDELNKVGAPVSSLKDSKKIVQTSSTNRWGRIVEVVENKIRAGLGFQQGPLNANVKSMQEVSYSGGFIHKDYQHLAALIEDNGDEDETCTNFVTHDHTCKIWVVVDIPFVMHHSKLVLKPIEYNDLTPSLNFDFPVFKVEEEIDDEEVSDELSRFLEHEEKAIQLFEEHVELVNLGSDDDVKEVKIGSQLCPEAKKGLFDLLREYSDVFSWSYQDMRGLDSDIVEHRLLLKPECLSVKQKLRRTHPNMAVKIKEEVQKQIDVGFLVTSKYPQWVANIVHVPK
ncbi:hypothetical protein KIW84_041283 [Lathyrus oleraceus]|uniref:Uncharacterized protein n=1 Tax=Pisum sativum TaxID=3888 RepID=A0A9D4XB45_PEA|nr:hypothetical protein KIW84_041283 [Pisum sativum]